MSSLERALSEIQSEPVTNAAEIQPHLGAVSASANTHPQTLYLNPDQIGDTSTREVVQMLGYEVAKRNFTGAEFLMHEAHAIEQAVVHPREKIAPLAEALVRNFSAVVIAGAATWNVLRQDLSRPFAD